jgi:hypothetical protein
MAFTVFCKILQGRDASGAEVGASAKLVVDLDQERFNGNATHIRIPQGQETRHFLSVLGKDQPLIIHKGKGVSVDDVERPKPGPRLVHIRGVGKGTYGIQVGKHSERLLSFCHHNAFGAFLIAFGTLIVYP